MLALQTMLFFKQPGQAGQGYHQDAYYIPTQPDTLCGAWLALDPATEENGCLWMTVGSQHEPIYPDDDVQRPADRLLDDIDIICNASHPDTTKNTLSKIAAKYPGAEVKVEAEPGDVVFFGGHVLHRSHANHATYSRTARSSVTTATHAPGCRGIIKGSRTTATTRTICTFSARCNSPALCAAQIRDIVAANAPELYGQRLFDQQPHSMMGDRQRLYDHRAAWRPGSRRVAVSRLSGKLVRGYV